MGRRVAPAIGRQREEPVALDPPTALERLDDFGGLLDCLCDAVCFGAAPAILMTRTVVMVIRNLDISKYLQVERVVWSVGAIYLACTVMRLAKFNVENEPDESAHMDFCGLPSPGAAGVVASLVLLFARLTEIMPDWHDTPWFLITVSAVLPAMTLTAALLMVSNIRYAHLVNHWIRGRRPLSYLLKLVVVVLALVLAFTITAAVFANLYALSGVGLAVWRRFRPEQTPRAEVGYATGDEGGDVVDTITGPDADP